MDFYTLEFLNFKIYTNQFGGLRFLDGYTEIGHYGQFNCGIYVKESDKTLIKCTTQPLDENKIRYLRDIQQRLSMFVIFPRIYDNYVFDGKYYTKMDKFDYDLTKLMYDLLPRRCLYELCIDGFIRHDEINKYFNIFDSIMDKYKFFNGVNDGFLYSIPKNSLQQLKILYQNRQMVTDDLYLQRYLFTLDNIISVFSNFNFSSDKFEMFMGKYCFKFTRLLKSVFQQIFKLKLLAISVGYKLGDNKFDNYGLKLSVVNKQHLGTLWNDNMIHLSGLPQYFFVSCIDYESVLSALDKTESNIFVKDFKYNEFYKYGQYKLSEIRQASILPVEYSQDNFLNLPEDIIKFLQNPPLDIGTECFSLIPKQFKSIEEIDAFINDENTFV
jgi:hypothetical protein